MTEANSEAEAPLVVSTAPVGQPGMWLAVATCGGRDPLTGVSVPAAVLLSRGVSTVLLTHAVRLFAASTERHTKGDAVQPVGRDEHDLLLDGVEAAAGTEQPGTAAARTVTPDLRATVRARGVVVAAIGLTITEEARMSHLRSRRLNLQRKQKIPTSLAGRIVALLVRWWTKRANYDVPEP